VRLRALRKTLHVNLHEESIDSESDVSYSDMKHHINGFNGRVRVPADDIDCGCERGTGI